jgi:hypothetical protein
MRQGSLWLVAGLGLLLWGGIAGAQSGLGDIKAPLMPNPLDPPPPPGQPATVPFSDPTTFSAPIDPHPDDHATVDHHAKERDFGEGVYFTGDYLLLRARRNALDYAVSSPGGGDIAAGDVQSVAWETRSGFRFGAGYQLPEDCWRIGLTYTYFYTAGDRSINAPSGGQLFATLTRAGSIDDVSSASAFTSLSYNVIDLDATRLVKVGKDLDVQLFGGGRFAWIDQKLDATYNGGSSLAVNDMVQSPVYFRGAGLTGGGQGFWKIWHDVGLYGGGRLSLLSGEFRNFLTETNGNGAVTVVNIRDVYYQIVPVVELNAGIAYVGEHFRFSVGYELTNWFNMVNSPDFATSSNIGKVSRRTSDLTLEGLAVELGVLF